MANIKITTVDANHIKVEFQDYYPDTIQFSTSFYNRADIKEIKVFSNNVQVEMLTGEKWNLSDTGAAGILEVDDIDGTTSWADLTTLAAQIAALIVA